MGRTVENVLEFHLHTCYSKDCDTSIDFLLKHYVGKIPIITDHNTIKGALEYSKRARCVIGEEVMTRQGEIIGLFLKEEIRANQDAIATAKEIRRQGGLIAIPHPFDRLRKKALESDYISRIEADIIEVFNSRTLFSQDNAKEYAKDMKTIVGSDAHLQCEYGNTQIRMEDFNSSIEFLANLDHAAFKTKSAGILVHMITKIIKIKGNFCH